jgi:hypothetical protein
VRCDALHYNAMLFVTLCAHFSVGMRCIVAGYRMGKALSSATARNDSTIYGVGDEQDAQGNLNFLLSAICVSVFYSRHFFLSFYL